MSGHHLQALEAAAALLDVVYVLRLEPVQAFEYVSESVEALVGYSPGEHYADPMLWMRLLDPRDTDVLQAASEAPLGELTEFTVRWITRDGRRVWTQHRCVRQQRDDGAVVLYGAAREVTRQQEDQQRRQEAEERYRLMVENSSDFVAPSYDGQTLAWVSDSVTRVLGWRMGRAAAAVSGALAPDATAGPVSRRCADHRAARVGLLALPAADPLGGLRRQGGLDGVQQGASDPLPAVLDRVEGRGAHHHGQRRDHPSAAS